MSAVRHAAVALLVAAACLSGQAHGDEAAAAARLPGRIALLARAQAELEGGDATAALDDFERAAMMLHAADAELGLIRAAMQDGQYRRALAFCAHTAGEHTDDADGGALYAWLLRVGGQAELAARTLADVRARAPADPVAAAVDAAFGAREPIASAVLLQPLHRMAPWPVMLAAQSPPPDSARLAGNGVLLDDGATAIVRRTGLPVAAGARLWVRNGRGQTTEALAAPDTPALAAQGLALLQLRAPLPAGPSPAATGHAPFAGSPGYSVGFGAGAVPAWPTLTQGFLGNATGEADHRRLGFGAVAGAPVLDVRGALVGIALEPGAEQATWLPAAAWTTSASPAPPATPGVPPAGGPALVAPDAVYEAGLRRALQVLVDGPP